MTLAPLAEPPSRFFSYTRDASFASTAQMRRYNFFLRRAQQCDAPDVDADDCASRHAAERASVMRLSSRTRVRSMPIFDMRVSTSNADAPMPPSADVAGSHAGKRASPTRDERANERSLSMRKRPLAAGVVVSSNWG
ncbi:hypothetical protein QZM22_10625 [Burkholderia oklahomensis]|uniref:hypothetical protein n=1 Tax=Burkholderia oklahomensis TaxID=342113 RepID=UPI00265440DF|nr:hypothetical protein [Burkholderia oklahomensis]MDN7672966.1 hypothetical protein [Burkholderia oklahomensis]